MSVGPCAAPTSTSTCGRMACSPPWRGARRLRACGATDAAGGWSWPASRRRRSIRATTTRDARAALPERIDRVSSRRRARSGSRRCRGEAEALLDDFHAGVLELGAPFELWAAPCSPTRPGRASTRCSTRARVGLCLPAGALASRAGSSARAGARALERARRAAVRPSRAGAGGRRAGVVAGDDRLRRRDARRLARVGGVGAAAHPRLRVVFAMLAGLAPLHAERLAARGGPARGGARPAHRPSTPPPTARARSTRCCASSASTGCSTAPTGR